MSCSDKIATWAAVGMQGALLLDLGFHPIYIKNLVIGDVVNNAGLYGELDLVMQDCTRAFGGRLAGMHSFPGMK